MPDRPKVNEQATIVVSLATPDDAAAIVNIQAETWLATYPNEEHGITLEDIRAKKLDDPKRIEQWKKTIKEEGDGHRVWVAKEGSKIIGYCLARQGEKENYIDALYVSSTEQGRGIGQKLMTEVLNWLGETKPIGLGVALYNTKAIGFYKKLGFEETDDAAEPVPPLPSGKILPIIKLLRPGKSKAQT